MSSTSVRQSDVERRSDDLQAFAVESRTLTAATIRRPPRATLALAYTGQRLLSGIIDAIPILGISTGLWWLGLGTAGLIPDDVGFLPEHLADLYNSSPTTLIAPLIALVVSTVGWMLLTSALFGMSPGKRLLRLDVVDSRGMPLTTSRQIARALACGASVATLGLGWLVSLILPSRRALHDILSDTYVVLTGGEAEKLRRALQQRSSKTDASTSRVQA